MTDAVDFSLGQDDDGIPWSEAIRDDAGNAIDVTGATSVLLHYRIEDASLPAVERVGAPVGTAPDTKVRYVFRAADTAAPGLYRANWIVTLASGEKLTFPPDRHMRLQILAKT